MYIFTDISESTFYSLDNEIISQKLASSPTDVLVDFISKFVYEKTLLVSGANANGSIVMSDVTLILQTSDECQDHSRDEDINNGMIRCQLHWQ